MKYVFVYTCTALKTRIQTKYCIASINENEYDSQVLFIDGAVYKCLNEDILIYFKSWNKLLVLI